MGIGLARCLRVSGRVRTGNRQGVGIGLRRRNNGWKKPDDDDVLDRNITMNYTAFIMEKFEA